MEKYMHCIKNYVDVSVTETKGYLIFSFLRFYFQILVTFSNFLEVTLF